MAKRIPSGIGPVTFAIRNKREVTDGSQAIGFDRYGGLFDPVSVGSAHIPPQGSPDRFGTLYTGLPGFEADLRNSSVDTTRTYPGGPSGFLPIHQALVP